MKKQLYTSNILNFIFGGKSTFTVRNDETGNRFTYKVSKLKNKDIFFVSVLTGNNNEENFTFIGTIFDKKEFVHSKKSKISKEAISVKAFSWVFKRLNTSGILDTVSVWHEGFCAKCGRKLTVPESIESGFGPECAKTNKVLTNNFKAHKSSDFKQLSFIN